MPQPVNYIHIIINWNWTGILNFGQETWYNNATHFPNAIVAEAEGVGVCVCVCVCVHVSTPNI